MKRFFLGICCVIFLSGCATTKFVDESGRAEEELKTLVIGQIEVSLTKLPAGYMNLEGVHRANVEIRIENIATGEVTERLSRGKDGYFFLINPAHLRYRIIGIKVTAKKAYKKMWYDIPVNASFSIGMNRVNNLGVIKDSIVYRERQHELKQDFKGRDIKAWFKETFPESLWNEKEWVDVEFAKK